MHAWTTVTDAPVWPGIARAKTVKDHRRDGDGGFPGFRRRLQATTTVYGPVPKVVGRGT